MNTKSNTYCSIIDNSREVATNNKLWISNFHSSIDNILSYFSIAYVEYLYDLRVYSSSKLVFIDQLVKSTKITPDTVIRRNVGGLAKQRSVDHSECSALMHPPYDYNIRCHVTSTGHSIGSGHEPYIHYSSILCSLRECGYFAYSTGVDDGKWWDSTSFDFGSITFSWWIWYIISYHYISLYMYSVNTAHCLQMINTYLQKRHRRRIGNDDNALVYLFVRVL